MSNTSKITMTLVGKTVLSKETLPSEQIVGGPGPLVNMYLATTGDYKGKYIVTVLAYLPSKPTKQFNNVKVSPNTEGISLDLEGLEKKVYLTYNGVKVITTRDRNDNRQLVDCRDFAFEYNCAEDATEFNLCHFQFTYSLDSGTDSVDSILVRDINDDPRFSRGTVVTVSDDDE